MSQLSTNPQLLGRTARLEHSAELLLNEKHWSYLQKRYHITPRELEIAQMVCRGFANEEIAEALKIKHGTVKTHVRNLYRKVWVRNKISMLLKFVADANEFFNRPKKTDSLHFSNTRPSVKPIE